MAKNKNDIADKVNEKLKEFQFKSPQHADNPKLVEKKLKEVLKEKPKKEEKTEKTKKSSLSRKEIIKKVSALLN